jgi:hypothetical protein
MDWYFVVNIISWASNVIGDLAVALIAMAVVFHVLRHRA